MYDAVGNVLARIDAAGRLTKYDYDQIDRVVAVRQVDGAWPAAVVATTTQGGTANEVQRGGIPLIARLPSVDHRQHSSS